MSLTLTHTRTWHTGHALLTSIIVVAILIVVDYTSYMLCVYALWSVPYLDRKLSGAIYMYSNHI